MFASFPEELPYWFDVRRRRHRRGVHDRGRAYSRPLAVGLLPAVRAAKPDLVNDLKEAARGTLARPRRTTPADRSCGVAGGAVLRPAGRRQPDGPQFPGDADAPISASIIGRILSARGYLAGDAFDDITARAAFYRQRRSGRLSSLPGVAAAAVTTSIPGDDGGSERRLVIDGRTAEGDEINVQAHRHYARGCSRRSTCRCCAAARSPTRKRRIRQSNVAVINQRLARPAVARWQIRSIGASGSAAATRSNWLRVVGVAPDVHYEEIGEDTEQSRLNVYLPYAHWTARGRWRCSSARHGSPEALDRRRRAKRCSGSVRRSRSTG